MIALGFVEVVLVLLGVGQAALELGKAAGALRGRQIFEVGQECLLFLKTPPDGFKNCEGRAGQAALEDGAD